LTLYFLGLKEFKKSTKKNNKNIGIKKYIIRAFLIKAKNSPLRTNKNKLMKK